MVVIGKKLINGKLHSFELYAGNNVRFAHSSLYCNDMLFAVYDPSQPKQPWELRKGVKERFILIEVIHGCAYSKQSSG